MNRLFFFVFLLAGMPALVYQVVWQRVLTLYFGVDIYSTTVAVGAFMLGLGIGSLLGGRAADRTQHPVRLYMACELLIGLFGVASLPLFSVVGNALAAGSLAAIIPVKFGLLLIPSLLMGMTLPLMCRIVTRHDATIGGQLSRLYGVNTLGAAVGALLASYLLIGLWGLDGACHIAAGLNGTVAAIVWWLASRSSETASGSHVPAGATPTVSVAHPRDETWSPTLLAAFAFLSGFVGLGYELAWYRLLGCLLHGTVYVFGTILCVYLLGIAAGSLAARRRIDGPDAVGRFARSQLAIGLYALGFFCLLGYGSWMPGVRHVIAASMYTSFHPSPDLIEGEFTAANIYSLVDIPLWAVAMLGMPTWMMGYGLPNLIRAGSRSVTVLGQSVGRLYFANILGATSGTLLVGLVTLDVLGSERTLALLIALGCVPAIYWGWRSRTAGSRRHGGRWALAAGGTLVASLSVFPPPGQLIRAIHYADFAQVDYVAAREDRTGVVVLKNQREVISFAEEQKAVGRYRLYIDGAAHGGMSDLNAVELDQEAPLALAAVAHPRRALCIGLGDGKFAVAVAQWPHTDEVVVVELNASLRSVLSHTGQGRYLDQSSKIRFVVDDGRRWLLVNSSERFDVILMWPLHAAHAHSGSLFSLEFLSLCRERLTEGGVLYLRSADPFSTARTVATAFPHVVRVGNNAYFASARPFRFDGAKLGRTPEEMGRLVDADRETILAHTTDAPLIRDMAPQSEYYITYPWRRFLSSSRKIDELIYRRPASGPEPAVANPR